MSCALGHRSSPKGSFREQVANIQAAVRTTSTPLRLSKPRSKAPWIWTAPAFQIFLFRWRAHVVLEHAVWVVCWEVVNQSQGVLFSGQPLHVVCEHLTNCSYAAHLMATLGDFDRKMATCLCSDVIGHLPFATQCPGMIMWMHCGVRVRGLPSVPQPMQDLGEASDRCGFNLPRHKQNTPALYLAEWEWVQLQ